jgi:hypothetical protein
MLTPGSLFPIGGEVIDLGTPRTHPHLEGAAFLILNSATRTGPQSISKGGDLGSCPAAIVMLENPLPHAEFLEVCRHEGGIQEVRKLFTIPAERVEGVL